ncbi:MAG TPA: gluconokinase, partial [Chitinophagaceae bacterium]
MKYYLGVDIGTTSVKAIAFSDSGDVLAKHAIAYGMQHPNPDWSEQDPAEIERAVTQSINSVVARMAPAKPALLSFSAAMHSLLAVDATGQSLTPCMIWADNRAALIAESLRETDTGQQFYHATGTPIHAMSPFCKLLWLKANEPAVFAAAHKFIGIKEYLFYKWFGVYAIDSSIASASGLLNLVALEWDKAILNFVGIDAGKLSTPVPVKEIFHYEPGSNSGHALQLDRKTPFVIGSSDGALANIATGSYSLVVTIGTSSAARILTPNRETDKYMRSFCYHARDSEYIVGGAGNNGAVVLQWLKESLLQTTQGFEQLFAQAAQAPPGSDGLLFLPYILGERAPLWNPRAKGVFFGLDISHTRAHMIRAVLEGIIYGVYSIGRVIMENNDPTEIYAGGGFAQSSLWVQVLADVFNKKV